MFDPKARMSDCLMASKNLFSHIMARTSCILMRDDVRFVLDQHTCNMVDGFLIMIAQQQSMGRDFSPLLKDISS